MKLRNLTLGLLSAAAMASTLVVDVAVAAEKIFVPGFVYRTGPYAPGGIPSANGLKDLFTMINERDGGCRRRHAGIRGM